MEALRKVRTVFLDLDDTLYSQGAGFSDELRGNIERFMVERLGVRELEACELRRAFFRAHGSTLSGLRHHFGGDAVDPEEFWRYIYNGIEYAAYISPDPELVRMLRARDPEYRVCVFTNAHRDHAVRALGAIGVSCPGDVDQIIDVSAMSLRCKPSPSAFARALELAQEPDASCAVLVDDQLRNVKAALACGWQAIWLRAPTETHLNSVQREAASDDAALLTSGSVPPNASLLQLHDIRALPSLLPAVFPPSSRAP
eukprot:CAMPEP_0185831922 /NCGR_PEP_ID=MMETSP1353-20130828/1781_1 /TAXON_ID=1077150 /ORGANISM="Erythrolobus australicus, Strain CCMP3124" /LENGTH=255 /DNA_ID=CAMNT_0028530039 /DNA_START=105 /DNA_END=872 /DNA_ORIENTATION=+